MLRNPVAVSDFPEKDRLTVTERKRLFDPSTMCFKYNGNIRR